MEFGGIDMQGRRRRELGRRVRVVRRALRTEGGPEPPPSGTGAHAARPDGGGRTGRAAALSAAALTPMSVIRQEKFCRDVLS